MIHITKYAVKDFINYAKFIFYKIALPLKKYIYIDIIL